MNRLVLPLLLLAACAEQAAPPVAPGWDPCGRGDVYRIVHGEVRSARVHRLSRWFGRADTEIDQPPPALLGETRDALIVSLPSEFRVPVPARALPWRLRAALRPRPPAGARPGGSRGVIRVEVRHLDAAGTRPLLQRDLAAAADVWEELSVELPAGASGEIVFRAHAEPAGHVAGELEWASPSLWPIVPPSRARSAPPDVLLVVVDTLRADALAQAPILERLLRRGTVWPAAVAPSNWTLPAFASLFTAAAPGEHGAGRAPGPPGSLAPRDLRGLEPGLPTLAERFRAAGYATAMVHANPFLEPWSGLDRGFERYLRVRDDTATALAAAGAWWQEADDRPRFLVLHLMAPHLPYAAPGDSGPDPLADLDVAAFLAADHSPEERRAFFDLPEAARAAVVARYQAEVAALDRELGPWLEQRLEVPAPPLLAFVADHGEELWDEGSFEHGHDFPDAVVRVPLAVVWPAGLAPGLRHEAVGAHWLAPTLLRLCGLERPAAWSHDLEDRDGEVRSTSTLYPSARPGRAFDVATGASRDLDAAEAAPADGPPATPDPELAAALRELGYLDQ